MRKPVAMNRKMLFCLIALWLISNDQLLMAQSDSTLSRVVTVERDFQPIIQSAGKINQQPAVITHDIQLNPVVYSTYSTPLTIGYNLNLLPASETQFLPQAPLQGQIEGAGGYRNTHFLFDYQIHKKKMSLNLYAKHDAYWGIDTRSKSQLGMEVTRHFSKTDLYFAMEGNNDWYSYYGRYYDGNEGLSISSMSQLTSHDWQTLWQAGAKIGVRSTGKEPFQYRIQTGYNAFIVTNFALEHQVKSYLDLTWNKNPHGAGAKICVQNSFYTLSETQQTQSIAPRHAIRVEPFYEYKDKHIRLHAGVNIDMNIGSGELLSNVKNLSFAPSPNVQFEWRMMDDVFHVYAIAQGEYGVGTLEEYMGYNRYLNPIQGIKWDSPRAYTPVDAQIGFKLRPTKTLLIDLYGGYAYMHSACNMQAEEHYDNQGLAYYSLWQSQFQRWKVGANLHYHYRDIVELNMGGNYYFYQQDPIPSMDPTEPHFQENRVKGTSIFDRPNWDAYARLDIHIDSKWSVYSENYFAGSRVAFVQTYPNGATAITLAPIISLNIGGQYAINRWLSVYAEVNDYLNRKHDIFYGYKSQGIHFLVGVNWKF